MRRWDKICWVLLSMMVFACSRSSSVTEDETDPPDSDSETGTDLDSDSSDEDVWHCFDGALDFDPELFGETNDSWLPTGPFW